MRLTEHIHLVASGAMGFSLTEDHDCHVYLVVDGGDAVLIDSGAGIDPDAVLRGIADAGVTRVSRILLTHAHADHVGGAAAIAERLGSTIHASAPVARILRAGDAIASGFDRMKVPGGYPADYAYRAVPEVQHLAIGDVLEVGTVVIEVIDGSGHSAGHLCFALRRAGGVDVFSGDAVFALGRILLQDLPDCSIPESTATVARLAALDPDGLFPGHGAVSIQGARGHLGSALADVAAGLPPRQLTF